MSSVNRKSDKKKFKNHEGGKSQYQTQEKMLKRAVLSCLLWGNSFYEDGTSIAERIEHLADKCSIQFVQELAIEARTDHNLRHVPLLLLTCLFKKKGNESAWVVSEVIKRPDEMGELIAIYWRDGKKPLPAQMKKGLAECFHNFSEFQFSKYANKGNIRIRDVLRLVHPFPGTKKQGKIFGRIASDSLKPADTWDRPFEVHT